MGQLDRPESVEDPERELALESLDTIPAVVWEFDPRADRFTYVNAFAAQLLGWTWPAWRMPGFWEAQIHPDDRAKAVGLCRAASRAGEGHELEYRILAEDGRTVWVHDSVRVLVREGGLRLRGVMVDVTAQRAEQDRRVTSEQQLRALLESFDGFIMTFDRQGRVNAAFGRGLKYSRVPADTLLGMTIGELHKGDEPQDEAAVWRALAGETVEFERTSRLHPENMTPRRYVIRTSPLRNAEDQITGVLATIHDVTRQREMERSMITTDRLASMGALAAGVAHEIRNPLVFVTANVEFLEQEIAAFAKGGGVGAARASEWVAALQDIHEGAGRVAEIAAELTGFSRMDQPTVPVKVAEVIDGAVRLVAPQVKARGFLHVQVDGDPVVEVDRGKLQQILVNLVINALQAAPAGHEAEIGLRAVKVDGKVQLTVEDNGPGIPPEVLPRIFEPFFTTKPVGLGTGLGLAIVGSIVRAYQGTITAENRPQGGARFTVVLPGV